ncbi:glycosyltransferase family 32 protein [Blautia sp.]|jgi:mannosyltransferase OCH1-like enzyme|uniref:glycosyltransferase family 32 protein n=1 Tax=Blautia sp. TaxID=1955243 RepID=UPI003D8A5E23
MIPKIIHYCWFGGSPLPESALKCIASWRKFLPNYEIKEWNEKNFPIEECPLYAKQAYAEKKWAFVSDYARFKILYDYGGLYFDTDVEVIKSLDDIIECGSFMGCGSENETNPGLGLAAAPGLGLAAAPGLGLYREILDYYNTSEFDASGNITVVQIVTEILKKKGFKATSEIQYIEGVRFYPPEYFSPIDYSTGRLTVTKNTRSIHHYDASWMEPKDKYAQIKARALRRILPSKMAGLMAEFLAVLKFEGANHALKKLIKWIQR